MSLKVLLKVFNGLIFYYITKSKQNYILIESINIFSKSFTKTNQTKKHIVFYNNSSFDINGTQLKDMIKIK